MDTGWPAHRINDSFLGLEAVSSDIRDGHIAFADHPLLDELAKHSNGDTASSFGKLPVLTSSTRLNEARSISKNLFSRIQSSL